MKLIHTSDWHLGRTLHGVDMLEHQARHLDHLVELTRDVRPAAVLVSGDVYDRAVPPVAAVEVLEGALRRLAEVALVIVISGNHDSATRLGFASALMRPEIRLVTGLGGVGRAVELADPAGGPGALVYPIPFLDVYDAAARLGSEDNPLPRSHEAVLGAAMGLVRADLARRGAPSPARPGCEVSPDGRAADVTSVGEGRIRETPTTEGGAPGAAAACSLEASPPDGPAVVVMAHAFVTGGQGSESERDLTVGGVDRAPASVFAGADYVALGHLHGPQVVTGQEGQVLRYSGSPLAFSFSEMGQVKSTAVVTLGKGAPAVELVPAPVPRPLGEVQGTIAELESGAGSHLAGAWVKVLVTDATRPDDLTVRVKRLFPHFLQLAHVPEGFAHHALAARVTAASSPRAVTAEFVEYAGGAAVTAAELAQIDQALEAVLRPSARRGPGGESAGDGQEGAEK
jgi:exonuclease SbcD